MTMDTPDYEREMQFWRGEFESLCGVIDGIRETINQARPTQAPAKANAQGIDELVDRFLTWPLPASVCSDTCVTDREYKFPRSGTNLLTADEARQMIAHVLGLTPPR